MNLAVVFPNIEALCVQFLAAHLPPGVDVATRMPADWVPGQMVRVTRTGGGRVNVGIDAPQVLFECWSTSDYAASELALITRALVGSMDEFGSEFGGVTYFPDSKERPRYQFAAQFFTAGEALEG